MRSRLFVFTIVVILIIFQAPPLYSEEPAILNIREHFKYIKANLKTYKKSFFEHTYEHPQAGIPIGEYITKYKKDAMVMHMSVDVVGDLSGNVTEFYYWDNKLMFVYEYSWHGAARQHVMREQRYYFNEGKMIRWLNFAKDHVPRDSEEFKKKCAEVIKLSEKYLSLAEE